MSDEAWTTLKVLFGETKANQILLDAIKTAQEMVDQGNAWQCEYCKRINKSSLVKCEGCGAGIEVPLGITGASKVISRITKGMY